MKIDVVPSVTHEPMNFWSWAHEHWFLTFLLAYCALQAAVYIAHSMSKKDSKPPSL